MKKAFIDQKLCVACGCCLTACKLGAVSIPKGVYAIIDTEKCVGCGMCAKKCAASIITVREVNGNA
jgi:heterodisulfide reductase subunit A-like polyferredoxin